MIDRPYKAGGSRTAKRMDKADGPKAGGPKAGGPKAAGLCACGCARGEDGRRRAVRVRRMESGWTVRGSRSASGRKGLGRGQVMVSHCRGRSWRAGHSGRIADGPLPRVGCAASGTKLCNCWLAIKSTIKSAHDEGVQKNFEQYPCPVWHS